MPAKNEGGMLPCLFDRPFSKRGPWQYPVWIPRYRPLSPCERNGAKGSHVGLPRGRKGLAVNRTVHYPAFRHLRGLRCTSGRLSLRGEVAERAGESSSAEGENQKRRKRQYAIVDLYDALERPVRIDIQNAIADVGPSYCSEPLT